MELTNKAQAKLTYTTGNTIFKVFTSFQSEKRKLQGGKVKGTVRVKHPPLAPPVTRITLTFEGVYVTPILPEGVRFMKLENVEVSAPPDGGNAKEIPFLFRLPSRVEVCPNAQRGSGNELLHDRLPPLYGNPFNCGFKFHTTCKHTFYNRSEYEAKMCVVYYVKVTIHSGETIVHVGRTEHFIPTLYGAPATSLVSAAFKVIRPTAYYNLGVSSYADDSDAPLEVKVFHEVWMFDLVFNTVTLGCRLPDPIPVDGLASVIPVRLVLQADGERLLGLINAVVSLVLKQVVYTTAVCRASVGNPVVLAGTREGQVVTSQYELLKRKNVLMEFSNNRSCLTVDLDSKLVRSEVLCPTFHTCGLQVMYALEVSLKLIHPSSPPLFRKYLKNSALILVSELPEFSIAVPVVLKRREAPHWISKDDEVFYGPRREQTESLPSYEDIL